MRRLVTVVAFAVVLAAGPAFADKSAAKDHYERGTRAYNLGRFDQAIDHFARAYEAHPSPVFLFNIAQAHRLAGHCEKAAFFYRRYLSEEPDSPARAEIEGHLRTLADCAEEEPPPPAPPPPPPKSTSPVTTSTSPTPRAPPPAAPWVELRLEGGAAFLSLGDVDVPVQAAAAVAVGHPFRFDALSVTPALFAQFTSVPYEGGSSGTALLFGVGAGADVRYHLGERVALRGGVGLGVLLLSGLDEGNPITRDGNPASGALSLLTLRGQLGLDVFFNERVALALTPVSVGFSPRRDDFADGVKRVLRFELLGGLVVFL
ncbi:MAG: tetratricopeptide repeat protein [Deltaproteobacteria bacterium]